MTPEQELAALREHVKGCPYCSQTKFKPDWPDVIVAYMGSEPRRRIRVVAKIEADDAGSLVAALDMMTGRLGYESGRGGLACIDLQGASLSGHHIVVGNEDPGWTHERYMDAITEGQ